MYFSSNQISQLDHYSIHEKRQILLMAMAKLTVPEKFILNILKLCMLIPPFLLLANLMMLEFAGSLVIIFAIYVGITRPLSLKFACNHIDKAIKTFETNKADAQAENEEH